MAGSRTPLRPAEKVPAQAIWFPRARAVELRPELVPDVAENDVRIRTIASGVSHGTEMLVYRGQVPAGTTLDLPTLQGSFDFPIKYGYASVGRVVETGSAVEHLTAGDLVFVHHPHQTEFVVPASMAVRLPPDIEAEAGILLANVETAINVMLDAHPRLGERIAIFGQGVVGLLLTQLAKRAGASWVLTVDPVAKRRKLSAALGADATMGPDADLPERVRQMTGGLGSDIVIEASGNPAALAQALDCVAPEGTVVVCSWYGTKPVNLPLGGTFHRGRIRIISSQVGSIAPELSRRWTRDRRTRLAREMLSTLQLTDLIGHRFPFDRAADAFALVDGSPEETVQVILTYDEADV